MRCKNCGWTNDDNVSRCIKCNAPLQGSMIDSNYQNSGSNPSEREEEVVKKTLRESGSSTSYPNPFNGGDVTKCPNCGYPCAPGQSECPMCHTTIGQKESNNYQGQNQQRHRNVNVGGTINSWVDPTKKSFFTLKRLPWEGETVTYEPVSFSGDSIILNRSNSDANNNSITSREQALITCENGEFYIENRSDFKTTFLRADRKLKLQDGDVICLGNRMFEFRKS